MIPTLVQLMRGAVKSNTVQFNSIVLAVITAIVNTEFIQSNPQFVQIGVGVIALVNLLLRAKTTKPLAER